jgi:hypothetical protein
MVIRDLPRLPAAPDRGDPPAARILWAWGAAPAGPACNVYAWDGPALLMMPAVLGCHVAARERRGGGETLEVAVTPAALYRGGRELVGMPIRPGVETDLTVFGRNMRGGPRLVLPGMAYIGWRPEFARDRPRLTFVFRKEVPWTPWIP